MTLAGLRRRLQRKLSVFAETRIGGRKRLTAEERKAKVQRLRRREGNHYTQWMLQTIDESHLYQTARLQAYKKHGRDFMQNFMGKKVKSKTKENFEVHQYGSASESFNAIAIYSPKAQKQIPHHAPFIAWVALGFEERSLIIESMQTNKRVNVMLNDFQRATNKKAINYLLREAEEAAREKGFEEVKIRRPETLYYYHEPFLENFPENYDLVLSDHQARMRKLYDTVARNSGYKKEEYYYIKRLR